MPLAFDHQFRPFLSHHCPFSIQYLNNAALLQCLQQIDSLTAMRNDHHFLHWGNSHF
jgi:hypothetical protein